jgi:hypothetical protein
MCMQFRVRFIACATESCDPLRDDWSGDRITVGVRFSAPVLTGPGPHPASCTVVTVSLSRG